MFKPPLYKRYFFLKKHCEISDTMFKGWGYRYPDGPYFQSGNGLYGNWKYIDGSLAETKGEAHIIIKRKRQREELEVIKQMNDRYPTPPSPRKINERTYHPIKKH